MRLRVTLLQPGSATEAHPIQITADATATAGDVAAALAGAAETSLPAPDGRVLTLRVVDGHGRPRATTLDPGVSLLESGLRSGSTVEVAFPEVHSEAERGAAVAVVRVLSGPAEGSEVPLRVGTWDVGRSGACDVRLDDATVSKLHARIVVGDRIEIIDQNSANGVIVGGVPVTRVPLGPGDVVTLGGTRLTVVHLRPVGGAGTGQDTSTDIAFTRSPRVVARPRARTIDLPEVPRPTEPPRFPWLAMIAPLIMGAGLMVMTMNPLSLIFVGLSPVLMLGNYFAQRGQVRRKHALALEVFEAEMARAHAEVEGIHDQERLDLDRLYPSVGECLDSAGRLGDLLWCRRPELPEFLRVRLATGSIPALATAEEPRVGGMADLRARALALAAHSASLAPAPVVADLRSVGGLGLCGARHLLDGVATGIVAQVAILHSPAEVVLACLTSTAGKTRWSWLEWLPHTASAHSPLPAHLSADPGTGRALLAQLEELVETRLASGKAKVVERGPVSGTGDDAPSPRLPSVVVVVDEPLVDQARLTRVAERGPDAGVHVLWVAGSRAELPAACRAYLDIGDGHATCVGLVRPGLLLPGVDCESVDGATALRLARSLAPVVDAGAPIEDESDLPRSVSVVALAGQEECDDPEVTLARWRENGSLVDRRGPARPRTQPSSLRALVGHAGTEAFTLDLRTQGPHALVGGTTGAGKSEFLQAWVLGMAHAYSPDRVTFLFVDYKGGSAFAQCTELPHCVGLVTDLSPYLVRRALRSLRAELRYRERLLHDKRAKDLLELEKTGDPQCPPSLIIVVDEFAALVGEVPEFVDGVVDVAQRGRSLGLHLILATQRPAGVIKDNLRANTNLRVALRMADEHDSQDVLGNTMAAHFDPSIPGRGAAKTGPGRIAPFQAAYPGARTPAEPPAPPIEVVELDFGVGRAWHLPERRALDTDVASDISRVVATVKEAARRGAVPDPRKPWLDALAAVYDLVALAPRTDAALVLGVMDDPDEQRQVREYFRPDADGNILYVGAGGSGKSTALRSLAIASAITPRSGSVHVYGLDFAGGALASLEVMPNVGSIVPGDDEERVGRLIRSLSGLVEERAARFSQVRASTLEDYRQLAGRPAEPRILLLVDGFGAFRTEYEGSTLLLPLYTAFQRLLVDGRAVGVHVALTADRPSAVPMSVASAFQRRVVLRQADEDSYVAMGVPKDVLSSTSPPGRALQVDRPQELQLAILGDDVTAAAQARLMEELAVEIDRHHQVRPAPIRSLPAAIPSATLPDRVGDDPVLGVADETLEPVGFAAGGVLLLAGPSGSGRTTAVRWLAESIRRAHPQTLLVHVSARRSPLSDLDCWTTSAGGLEAAGEVLGKLKDAAGEPSETGVPLLAVFVEHFPDFVGTPVEMALQEVVKACRRNGHVLVAEGESATWASPWPLIMEVRNARTGLLLQPDQMDGDNLLRTSLPRIRRADFPPGRGFYVRAGKTVKVQIPLVEAWGGQPIDG